MRSLALIAALVFVAPALSGAASAEAPRTITVSGEAEVVAVPDMAVVTLGAQAQDETAIGAMNKTSEALDAIIARLSEMGIAARDIQTSALRLDERWDNSSLSGGRELAGYEASNMLTVRVRDLDALGDVLQAALDDGANSLSGLSFDIQDPRPLQDEARKLSVRDAMAKAQLYSEAAGVALGRVVTITDAASPMVMARDMPIAMMEARSVPIAVGEISLRGQVTMVFEIAQ
ncbi:SIMPL domain-containing protein [Tropicibacter oceani]|uniref:SIMPL domain-containing protein n=1 Tax=Tropicibacter oceani TaxID=3058420 RepID=A0ABY8QCS7_9RHOB|nr:SIMPL domain-containing protein [Tropicibacter oceani]WGW02233.1 SIMPL domain-containing protein [Tropicibacter oceani]